MLAVLFMMQPVWLSVYGRAQFWALLPLQVLSSMRVLDPLYLDRPMVIGPVALQVLV